MYENPLSGSTLPGGLKKTHVCREGGTLGQGGGGGAIFYDKAKKTK
jgi:hypothetical protein